MKCELNVWSFFGGGIPALGNLPVSSYWKTGSSKTVFLGGGSFQSTPWEVFPSKDFAGPVLALGIISAFLSFSRVAAVRYFKISTESTY